MDLDSSPASSVPSPAAPGEAGHIGTTTIGPSPESLYLDLLKDCLTRSGINEELVPVIPGSRWKRNAWRLVSRGLDERKLVVGRRVPSSVRDDGRDWPTNAETMIGKRRLENLQACIERAVADGVEGDVIETGVWRGGAAIFMRAVLATLREPNRVVWVADSFEGLPKPSPAHPADAGDRHWAQLALAVPLAEVQRNFARYRLLDSQVRFLAGWFCETLPAAPIERLAVLRVDCDMYGSTTDVLNSLYPKVSRGGFVIIDDYGAIPACRTAVDQYRREQNITEPMEQIDWTGVFWRRAS